jgi:hypothetical protein
MARATQHAHPADRCAREIAAILERDTMHARRLMRKPLGGTQANIITTNAHKNLNPSALVQWDRAKWRLRAHRPEQQVGPSHHKLPSNAVI